MGIVRGHLGNDLQSICTISCHCEWHIILVAELYTTCPGERVLVATKFNVAFLPLRLCYVNTSTCFSKDAENLTTWLRALMQSECLYSSLFFEHYIRILLCE